MSFNYRQRMTAMGHVVAFLATLLLCYVSFMGMVYLLKGHLVKSAVFAAELFMPREASHIRRSDAIR